jgi:hypothetical protein
MYGFLDFHADVVRRDGVRAPLANCLLLVGCFGRPLPKYGPADQNEQHERD